MINLLLWINVFVLSGAKVHKIIDTLAFGGYKNAISKAK
jgi:hypothetical protein